MIAGTRSAKVYGMASKIRWVTGVGGVKAEPEVPVEHAVPEIEYCFHSGTLSPNAGERP